MGEGGAGEEEEGGCIEGGGYTEEPAVIWRQL